MSFMKLLQEKLNTGEIVSIFCGAVTKFSEWIAAPIMKPICKNYIPHPSISIFTLPPTY